MAPAPKSEDELELQEALDALLDLRRGLDELMWTATKEPRSADVHAQMFQILQNVYWAETNVRNARTRAFDRRIGQERAA